MHHRQNLDRLMITHKIQKDLKYITWFFIHIYKSNEMATQQSLHNYNMKILKLIEYQLKKLDAVY